MITRSVFSQTNPTSGSSRTSPSLATELTNLNNELGNFEDAVFEGYIRENGSITRLSSNSFSINSDVTAWYTAGRILRMNSASTPVYLTVLSSSVNTGVTTVTTQETTVPVTITTIDLAIQAKGNTNPDSYGQNIHSPTISTPSISSPTVTNGTFSAPTVTNPGVTGGSFDTPNLTTPQVAGDQDMDTATGNITVQGSDPWRTISLASGYIKPTTNSGCAFLTQIEGATNHIDYDVLDFDQTTQERAYANVAMPASWDAGAIQFRFLWTAASGAGTFKLDAAGRSLADDDAVDQAVGTFVGVTDTLITAGDIHISDWSSDVTITGAGAGELVHLEFRRDVATDTLTADARLIAVQIRYKQGQYTD